MVLSGITWDHPRGYEPLVAAAKEYLKHHGVEIRWEKRSLKNFGDQSLTALAERFDLLVVDHPHTGVAAATECLLALDEYLAEDVFQQLRAESAGPSFDSYHYQGHQWAIPVDAAMQCASYRPDLLKQSLPVSWDEVFALAQDLKKEGRYVGMALCSTDSLCTFLSLTSQFGSPIKENDEELVDKTIGLKVLMLMRRMKDMFHPASIDWNPIQLYDHMAEHTDVVYAPMAFNYTNYSRIGFRQHLLKYCDGPHQSGVLGGAGIAVSAKCSHVQQAVDFTAWLCGADVQKGIYTLHQGQPGNDVAWKSKEANLLTNDFFVSTQKSLDYAYIRPRHKGWPAFQETLGEIVHDFLVTNRDPNEVLDILNKHYQKSSSDN